MDERSPVHGYNTPVINSDVHIISIRLTTYTKKRNQTWPNLNSLIPMGSIHIWPLPREYKCLEQLWDLSVRENPELFVSHTTEKRRKSTLVFWMVVSTGVNGQKWILNEYRSNLPNHLLSVPHIDVKKTFGLTGDGLGLITHKKWNSSRRNTSTSYPSYTLDVSTLVRPHSTRFHCPFSSLIGTPP